MILDPQRTCKDGRDFLYNLHLAYPNVNVLYYHGIIYLKIKKLTLDTEKLAVESSSCYLEHGNNHLYMEKGN